MRYVVKIVPLTLLLTACTNTAISPDEVAGPETWGGSDNVTHVRHLYFSEQPDAEALRAAKSKGVTMVIDLRHPSELDWDEKSVAESAGLTYVNIPITGKSATFNPKTIAEIDTVVQESEHQQILLHCSSGNRAAAWFAIHLTEKHGMTEIDALGVAHKTGLTHETMEKRVRAYLDRDNR